MLDPALRDSSSWLFWYLSRFTNLVILPSFISQRYDILFDADTCSHFIKVFEYCLVIFAGEHAILLCLINVHLQFAHNFSSEPWRLQRIHHLLDSNFVLDTQVPHTPIDRAGQYPIHLFLRRNFFELASLTIAHFWINICRIHVIRLFCFPKEVYSILFPLLLLQILPSHTSGSVLFVHNSAQADTGMRDALFWHVL